MGRREYLTRKRETMLYVGMRMFFLPTLMNARPLCLVPTLWAVVVSITVVKQFVAAPVASCRHSKEDAFDILHPSSLVHFYRTISRYKVRSP